MAASKKRRKSKARKRKQENGFGREILLWVVLAVSILLFVSNLGAGGAAGDVFSRILFGVLGLTAYAFPVLLFIGCAFFLSNRDNPVAFIKLAACVVFLFFLCVFLQLVVDDTMSMGVKNAYSYCANNRTGGGVIGTVIASVLSKCFGRVGTFVIDILVLVVCLILITEKSIFKGIKIGGKKAYDSAKQSRSRQLERKAEKRKRMEEEQALFEEEQLQRQKEIERLQKEREKRRKEKELEARAKEQAKQTETDHSADSQNGQMGEMLLFNSEHGKKTKKKQTGRRMDKHVSGITPDTTLASAHDQAADGLSELSAKGVPVREIVRPIQEEAFPYIDTDFVKKEVMSTQNKDGMTDFEAADLKQKNPDYGSLEGPEQANSGSGLGRSDSSGFTSSDSDNSGFGKPGSGAFTGAGADNSGFDEAGTNDVTGPATDGSGGSLSGSEPETLAAAAGTAAQMLPQATQAENAKTADGEEYRFPPIDLLSKGSGRTSGDSAAHVQATALKLQQTLKTFGVDVTITEVNCGPSVTRYELQPEMGVKVSKIVSLSDDIKLNLAAEDIRIEAPIPGKAAVGIEVPNKENVTVAFRDLISSKEFQSHKSRLAFGVGKDIAGKVVVADIAKMPHLLIAGATGSGKSVCINTVIMSILYHARPDEVKLIMIDPKVVELSVYNGIPHLFIPVVTDPKKAAGALQWAVSEMTDRYQKFAEFNVRDLAGYNRKIETLDGIADEDKPKKLPQIVIVVDELADLMMVAPGDVEDAICRLAQLARACGIHLIIATQRPSVNVITGLIKANMPSRIAFAVSSGVDSRTIIDMNGAEKLLGKGDMLFYPQGVSKPQRVQGAFVSDQEVGAVVDFLKGNVTDHSYDPEITEKVAALSESKSVEIGGAPANEKDAYFTEAAKLIIDNDKASIGMLQRHLKVGFNRAARIMDQLADAGVVGPEEGTKPRKVLMTAAEFEEYVDESG